MEEEGFGKRGSLSSSSSWASRLSPLAQPFTMKRQAVEQQVLNSLTSPNPSNHFAPSPSNHLDAFDDCPLPNSFPNLINLEDDQVLLPVSVSAPAYPSSSQPAPQSDSSLSASAFTFDGHKSSEFGAKASFSRFPLPSSSLTCETKLDGVSFDNKFSVSSTRTQCSVYQGEGRTEDGLNFVSSIEARAPAFESLVKQDSMINPHKIPTGTDVLSLSTFQNITQVPVFGSSGTSATFSPSSRASSSAADFTGNSYANNNYNSYNGNLSGKKELHVLPNADSHEVRRDKSLVYKGKEKKDVKSVSYKGLDSLLMAKSERRVTSEDAFDGLILGKSGTIAGLSLESSSKRLDENEDDLDSPCWKGIQNSGISPIKVSECLSSKSLQNDSEAGPSLNPQAPHFFPSHGKGIVDYSQSNLVGDGFPSSSTVSCKDKKLVDPLKAGPKPPGFSSATGYQYSNSIRETGKESFMLKSSKIGSSLSPPQMVKPSLVDGVFPEVNLAMEQIQNFPSSGVDCLNDFSQVLQSLSQSLSRCPNINVTMMVKAIHYLSKLLVQNCANDYDSLNADEHEMIRDVTNNLLVLINHRVGQKTPMVSLPTGGLDYRDKATTCHERPNMKFQVTSSKDLVVQRELDGWRNNNWGNSYSQATTLKMHNLVSSSRDAGSERGNNVNPAFRTALKENGRINEDLDPQALLNLWIEAQAALCSVKYENRILRRQLHMDEL